MIEALVGLAFLAIAVIAVLLTSRRIPPSAAPFFLVLLCVAACGSWKEATAAHDATLAAMREAAKTQHAIQVCLDRYPAGSSDLELALCIADVAGQVQDTAGAVQCQVDAVDALLDAVEGDAGAGGGA